jgi:biopolymer transport protein TolQ
MFRAGYLELEAQVRVQQQAGRDSGQIRSLAGIERALQRAIGVESARLQRFLPFLATTASATPFIGLFGTVWGIMNTFRAIAASGSTSIVTVAPGIAEALINTAAGLAAAIPAVIAYNAFLGALREQRGLMEDFLLEFLNLTERTFT